MSRGSWGGDCADSHVGCELAPVLQLWPPPSAPRVGTVGSWVLGAGEVLGEAQGTPQSWECKLLSSFRAVEAKVENSQVWGSNVVSSILLISWFSVRKLKSCSS